MLHKNEPEQEQPKLLGEDFDIFPSLDDDPSAFASDGAGEADAVTASEESKASESVEEEEPLPPTKFQVWAAKYSDKTWNRMMLVFGILSGLIACALLILLSRMETFSSIGLILALVVAVFVPTFFKRSGRNTNVLRRSLMITVIAIMVLFVVVGTIVNPDLLGMPTASTAVTSNPTAMPQTTVAP